MKRHSQWPQLAAFLRPGCQSRLDLSRWVHSRVRHVPVEYPVYARRQAGAETHGDQNTGTPLPGTGEEGPWGQVRLPGMSGGVSGWLGPSDANWRRSGLEER